MCTAWRRFHTGTPVKEAGAEAASWEDRALSSLQKGDVKDADDSLYFAVFLEKPIRGDAPVWGPVYAKFKAQAGAHSGRGA